MPHQTLHLQGGVCETETPVLNSAGISSSNRIRFLYDPNGLTLPQKLGGWAKFLSTAITTGVVRALWAWQDTNANKWLGWGTANTTDVAQLGVVECTTNATTGLTTATGSVQDITPRYQSNSSPVNFVAGAAGQSVVSVTDPAIASLTNINSVYITTPVSVAGIIIQGTYPILARLTSTIYTIETLDILGNPWPAVYASINAGAGPITTTGGSFSAGPPKTITLTFASNTSFPPVNEAVTINGLSTPGANGTFIVHASSATSVTYVTTLSAFTYGGTGTISNFGVVPIFNVVSGSNVITVTFPDHGLTTSSTFYVINETLVGGIVVYGAYQVQSVANSYTFTINGNTNATSTTQQFQNARTITGGIATGSSVTVDTIGAVYSVPSTQGPDVVVSGVNPAGWNQYAATTSTTTNSVTYANASTAGGWVSGGSVSTNGGDVGFIYSALFSGLGGTSVTASYWSLDNWGNDFLSLPVPDPAINYADYGIAYQPIYSWDPTAGQTQATPITNCPPASNGMFVAMPERQIIAWGSSFSGIIDPLLIRWCDINNFNTWVAQVTNQAGSFRLSSGAAIIGARQTPQQGLIWTDIELWSMQYINQPDVYSFNKIGQGCGLLGRYAHGVLGGIVYWMSKTQFWMLSGDGVLPIPCPIWDVAFQDFDLANVGKITCAPNSMFQEITWYFPVKSGNGENSQYIKLNVAGLVAGQGPIWDYGTLDRSAWIDVSVLQQPIGFSPLNEYVYQHEISPDADGAAMGETWTTGWFSVAEGDQMAFVDQWWPDFKWGYYGQAQNASVQMTINGQDYPGQSLYSSYGPYTVNQSTTYISPRIRHRLVSLSVSGTGTGTWWRLGGIRYRVAPDGKY